MAITRLVSKGGGEIDVSLAERLHSFAGNEQHARHNAFADEGHAQHAAYAGGALERTKRVFRVALGIIDEHGCIREKYARAKRAPTGLVTNTQDRAAFLFGKTDTRHAEEFVAKTTMDDDNVGLAQTSC